MSQGSTKTAFAVACVIFSIAAIAGMIAYSSNKILTIENTTEVSEWEIPKEDVTAPGAPEGENSSISVLNVEKAGSAKLAIVLDAYSHKNGSTNIEGIPVSEIIREVLKDAADSLTDKGIYVYMPDSSESIKESLDMINSLHRVVYTGISLNTGEASFLNAYYNPDFVIPVFGNIEASDILLSGLAGRIHVNARGLFPAGDGDILNALEIPGTHIEISIPKEDALTLALVTPEGRQAFGMAIADSIEEYMNKYV